MSIRVSTPQIRRAALACAILLAGFALAQRGRHEYITYSYSTRAHALIVRGHTQGVVAALTGAIKLGGALYPALPGANTLHLRVEAAASTGAGARGTLTLRIVMPGMAMRPIRVTLHEYVGEYRGTIVLPMFGLYIARVVLATPRRQWHGMMRLEVPLVLSH